MQDYKYSVSFENSETIGIASFRWSVSGAYTDFFEIKATLFKGIKVFKDNQMLMSAYKDVTFNNRRIGKYPRFSYLVFKGYFGRYESNCGVFEIRKSTKNTLNLLLDSSPLGMIDLTNSSRAIEFHLSELPSLPDLFIIAWELWSMENTSYDD